MLKERKHRFCLYGHDTKILGVQADNTCSECKRIRMRKWYRKDPSKKIISNMKSTRLRSYGLSNSEYEALIKKQNNTCAICKKKPTRINLSVDHNHKTSQVRGLLCTKCNLLLGLANDNVEILKECLTYLNK